MSIFPVFSVQVVFEFVNVGKTLIEMLYGLRNFSLHMTKQFSAEMVLQAVMWKGKNCVTYVYKFLSASGVSRVKIERNDVLF